MKRMWLLVIAAGCGSGAASRPSAPSSTTTAGGSALVSVPVIPRAPFDVAPGELADGDVYLRLRHRVRLARASVAYVKLDGPRVDDTGQASKLDTRPMYPVLAETSERVRIVAEEDHARIALWVPRSDAAQTVVAAVQISDATGHAPATSGVWLGAGASLDADERTGAAGFREVTLRSQWLEATGYVPAAALGNVWIAGEREGYEPTAAEDDKKPPVKTGSTVAATTLRATPDASGAVIAKITSAAPARVVTAGPSWTEIEIHVPRVRARGFVQTATVTPGDTAAWGSTGHGGAYGMSDTQVVRVPAGTCLYDAVGGEVAGVNLVETSRYASGARAPGWVPVVVSTAWGFVTAYVHDTAQATDLKTVVLESCAKK